ncbi:MAG: DUF2066 domain-containing protein [Kordiimonadaceae bacterium]|nr:DUF2066 domain-containing protein [Kordiimonadaceae bacterium]
MRRVLTNSMVFSRLAVFLGLASALFYSATTASFAQTVDSLDRLFTIQAVKVDVTARRASDARDQALAQAQSGAYDKLLRKITQVEGRALLPELTDVQKQSLVSGIQVVDEQSSARRYIASLDIRFEPGSFSRFLAEYKVPHVLGTGRGLIVLHAHTDGVANYLWQHKAETNTAYEAVDWLNRIRTYVFPRGELQERAMISYSEVANFKTSNVNKLAQRYDVESALLLSTEWKNAGNGDGVLAYSFHSTDGAYEDSGIIETRGENAETEAQRLMYEQVLEQIDSAWRDQLLVDTSMGGDMKVIVPSTTIDVLPRIEKLLSEVTLVHGVEVKSIGLPFGQIHFRYTGREDQLVLALRYGGLDLGLYGEDRILKIRTVE